jgi:HSP20 family molecular chaperone IbpA
MNVVKYDPFRDLRSLQDEMNRLFSGTFSRGNQDEVLRGAWSPSVDIFENKNEIVLEAELPGMNPEDVNISIENNILTLHGERRLRKKTKATTSTVSSAVTVHLPVRSLCRRRFRAKMLMPNFKTACFA